MPDNPIILKINTFEFLGHKLFNFAFIMQFGLFTHHISQVTLLSFSGLIVRLYLPE